MAVNAYVEPVVSLDLDIVVNADAVDFIKASGKISKIGKFPHSFNPTSPKFELRIQVQTDNRYQAFIPAGAIKEVMGYRMRVALIEDVLQGKIWAYADKKRQPSKRQKDLADILRLIETYPRLKNRLPEAIKKECKARER